MVREEEKVQIFQECHQSPGFAGHNGRDRTIQRIKEKYYWPAYYKDTVEMVMPVLHDKMRLLTNSSVVLSSVKITIKYNTIVFIYPR